MRQRNDMISPLRQSDSPRHNSLNRLLSRAFQLLAQTEDMIIDRPVIAIKVIVHSQADELVSSEHLIRMAHESGQQGKLRLAQATGRSLSVTLWVVVLRLMSPQVRTC